MIVQLASHTVANGKRLVPGQDGRAGIALLFSGIKVLAIAFGGNFRLSGLHFRLLQAEAICLLCGKVIAKALAKTSAQAVDVPGNQFHGSSIGIKFCLFLHYTG